MSFSFPNYYAKPCVFACGHVKMHVFIHNAFKDIKRRITPVPVVQKHTSPVLAKTRQSGSQQNTPTRFLPKHTSPVNTKNRSYTPDPGHPPETVSEFPLWWNREKYARHGLVVFSTGNHCYSQHEFTNEGFLRYVQSGIAPNMH